MASFDPNDPDMKYLAVDRKALMKEQTVPFDGKKMCWVPDEKEGFLAAEIQSTKGDEITVKTIEGNEVKKKIVIQELNIMSIKLWISYVRKNVNAILSARYMVNFLVSFCVLRTAQWRKMTSSKWTLQNTRKLMTWPTWPT